MANCVRKSFYSKILKCQKVFHQDKKIEKSANFSKCTEALNAVIKFLLVFLLEIGVILTNTNYG